MLPSPVRSPAAPGSRPRSARRRSLRRAVILAAVASLRFPFVLSAQEAPPDPIAPAARVGRGEGRGTPSSEIARRAAGAGPTLAGGPVQPTWDSLKANYKTPAWLMDGKFGIFIHWGLYSVPAHGSEWYAQHMYSSMLAWHTEHFGPVDKFGYKDFIPMFKAEQFDPDAWITLFKKAGARYVVPVAEHHDGFAMWDSALTRWTAAKMGPKRDIIGDLEKAARRQGLHFGVSNHRVEHYGFIPVPSVPSDLTDPALQDFYWTMNHGDALYQKFLEDWVARNVELIDKYHPEALYFDNGINSRGLDPIKLKVTAYFYNRAEERGQDVTMFSKGAGDGAAYLTGAVHDLERGRMPDLSADYWQEDTSIAHNSWGYNDDPLQYRNAGELIRELVDCVSKNGNYLLNLAPKADGTIPEAQQLRLLEMGEWLQLNGEAIYGTRAWTTFGEGPTPQGAPNGARGITDGMLKVYTAHDIRFTTKGDTLYAILFAWPSGDEPAVIASLAADKGVQGKVEKVEMLGVGKPLAFVQDEKGLTVKMPVPAIKPCEHAYVLKITGLKLK
ncbi:MAG TPA: alpha-L-fucosidase [Opitutaceae bacterium]|nr:alpha-L-fucosidase [Opitutaceae bacterium]